MTLEGWLNSLCGIPRHRAQAPVLDQGQKSSDLAWELNWARDGFCQVHCAWPCLRRGSLHTSGLIGRAEGLVGSSAVCYFGHLGESQSAARGPLHAVMVQQVFRTDVDRLDG